MRWIGGAALLVLVALAGCTQSGESGPSDSVTLTRDDVLPNDANGRAISCPSTGTITVQADGADKGDLRVTVRDGTDGPVWSQRIGSGGASIEEEVAGVSGTWVLRVDRSLEYSAPFSATLAC